MNIRYAVTVKTGAEKREVSQRNTVIHVSTPASAREGKANKDVVEQLAQYFNVPKSRIFITGGEKSKQKIVEIL
ncbi:MAG TPA: DUF167 domain-containing protein [Patescibacteria group bacterium]|nr:DUF167 domain-containing protein [Patescibacteria group bacterium]